MLTSTLALAMGLVLLATARLSGQAGAYGLVVFAGIVLVGAGCGLHLGSIIDALNPPALIRLVGTLAAWLVVAAGTGWLLGRTPGVEVVAGLMLVPAAVGVLGFLVTRASPWPAAAFLVVVALLIALLGPVWVERTGSSRSAHGASQYSSRVVAGTVRA